MENSMKAIGERIREYRKKAGLSIEKLAAQVGITYSYLSQIEHGRRKGVSLDIIMKIAEALDMPVSVLIGEDRVSSEAIKAIEVLKKIIKEEGK